MAPRRSRQDDPGGRRGRAAVLHTNLALLRTADAAQLDALLERAELRQRVVRRIAPDTLLVPRGALPVLRRRLADVGVPFEIGAPGSAGGGGRRRG